MSQPDMLLTRRALREPGWTKGLVAKFLGEADRYQVNPHCRTAPPMKLYLLKRIEMAEARPDFTLAQAEALRRAAVMRAVAERRRAERRARIERWLWSAERCNRLQNSAV